MSAYNTRVTVNAEFANLDAWKRSPRGYAVVVCPGFGPQIEADNDAVAKLLEKYRDEFDADPNGFRPRQFAITRSVFEDPRNEQFLRRAMVIVEMS